MFTAGSLMSQIKGGKVRPIATTGAKRMPDLPDIPTMTEAGVPDLVMEAFSGIAAPRGTPQAIVKRLETELIAVARLPEVRERLAQIGMQPLGETSAEFTARVAREIPMWTAVAKAANIKLD